MTKVAKNEGNHRGEKSANAKKLLTTFINPATRPKVKREKPQYFHIKEEIARTTTDSIDLIKIVAEHYGTFRDVPTEKIQMRWPPSRSAMSGGKLRSARLTDLLSPALPSSVKRPRLRYVESTEVRLRRMG